MAKNEHKTDSWDKLSDIEHIRFRPSMYIGGTDFFGFIQYLVSAFDLLFEHGATWIEFEVAENFRLTSDACVPIHLNERDELEPFEAFGKLRPRHIPDAIILMALSSDFRVTLEDDETRTELATKLGVRDSFQQQPTTKSERGTTLGFSPDRRIFSVREVSPSVAHSYCKRMSCLHPDVSIRIKIGDKVTEYKSTAGIRDFFDSAATLYQILHKPIYINESEGDLKVETVFAFHSWTENQIWSFANKGRVPDGGTQEAGLMDAIARLHQNQAKSAVGVLAILAIEYPGVTWEGCIKARIGNPELQDRVCKLITTGLDRWVKENEDEVNYLETIERFQFADLW